jgi:cysteine sulfinate desulfinase/cysteine desulfurase-like protein
VTGIVGLGKACEMCAQEMDAERERLLKLRKIVEEDLTGGLWTSPRSTAMPTSACRT